MIWNDEIIARRAAEEGWAPIRAPKQLVLLLLAVLFLGAAIPVGYVGFSNREWLLVASGALALVAAVIVTLLAFGEQASRHRPWATKD